MRSPQCGSRLKNRLPRAFRRCPVHERETVTCSACELTQYRTVAGKCRRCDKPLQRGTVMVTSVLILAVPSTELLPMRQVMQRAAVQAHRQCGGTMRAARVLGIPASRLKQLLRESGDQTDYRKERKARREGRL